MMAVPIHTDVINVNDELFDVLDRYVPSVRDGTVIAITSKVISVLEKRLVPKDGVDKRALIKREADFVLKTTRAHQFDICLTIKDGVLIPSAGIDESNVENAYVLYPHDVQASAEAIWSYIRKRDGARNFGVIITDSKTTIMRRGVTGIGLSWCGFEPLYSYINKPDIYLRPLKVTQVNIIDALATTAVFAMGEGNEQTPIVLLEQLPRMKFVDRPPSIEEKKSMIIPIEEDLYAPMLTAVTWE